MHGYKGELISARSDQHIHEEKKKTKNHKQNQAKKKKKTQNDVRQC